MSDKMQEEFEKSDFYFRGEKPARRIENWLLWKAAWDAALSQPAAVEGWKPLTDTQWLNIVNQDHAYDEYTKDDAVHKAVRLTEARLRMNNTALSTSPLLDKNDQTEGDPVDIDCTNMDAAHWAKAFCEKFPGHDEGLMLAWFASAIMCGWDNAHWKIKESNPQPDSNELMELRRDAERYRYLRMSPANEWKVYRWDTKVNCYRGRDGRDLDNAIDAALAQSPSKKGGE
jgi:hypothetical protein